PSEFAKFGTIVALSSYLGAYVNNLRSPKTIAYAVAFFVVPILLLLLQPDAGSALVFMSLQLVLFREGLSGVILIVELVFPSLEHRETALLALGLRADGHSGCHWGAVRPAGRRLDRRSLHTAWPECFSVDQAQKPPRYARGRHLRNR
ncbi:MAG: FtsW/RodA/SpoVE family cell cycle protein, partial [Saprospiraceae bacterium]|nr:FtsW/RodA/SpoVE family cell cycle protein [Saprospiraceae bacterium]